MTELGGDVGRSRSSPATLLLTGGRDAVPVLRRGDRPDRPEAGRADPHTDALGRRAARRPGSRPARRGSRSARIRRAPTSRPSAPTRTPSTRPTASCSRLRAGEPGAAIRRPRGRRRRRAVGRGVPAGHARPDERRRPRRGQPVADAPVTSLALDLADAGRSAGSPTSEVLRGPRERRAPPVGHRLPGASTSTCRSSTASGRARSLIARAAP